MRKTLSWAPCRRRRRWGDVKGDIAVQGVEHQGSDDAQDGEGAPDQGKAFVACLHTVVFPRWL